MSGIFKYKYQLLPADYDRFIKLYKEEHPKIIIKYDRSEQTFYAFKKNRKDLEWKYDRDNYQLYIDEPIKNYFFKQFMKKEAKIMKKSEIKQMIREEMQALKEASTLNIVGANASQIKTAHTTVGTSINAKSVWEKVTNKKELMNIINSATGKGWDTNEAIAGLDKSSNLFVVRMNSVKEWVTQKIDSKGKVVENWIDNNIRKAIAHLQGIKNYYVARKGSAKRSADPGLKSRVDYRNHEDALVKKTAEITKKYLEKNFTEIKTKIKDVVIKAVDAEDYAKAYTFLGKIGYKENYGDWHEFTLTDIISRGSWGGIERQLREKIADAINKKEWESGNQKDLTDGEIREVAYTIAVELKNDIIGRLNN